MGSNAGQPINGIGTLINNAEFASETFPGNICQIQILTRWPSKFGTKNESTEKLAHREIKIDREVPTCEEDNESVGLCTIDELPATPTPQKPKGETTPSPDSTTDKANAQKRKFLYLKDPNDEISPEKKKKINKAKDSKRRREEKLQYTRDLEAKVQSLTKENTEHKEKNQDLEKLNETLKLENEELKQAQILKNFDLNFYEAAGIDLAPNFRGTNEQDLNLTEEDLNQILFDNSA